MSKLGDRLVELLTGGRGDPAPPGDFLAQARALVARTGSQRRAAELAGVDRRTLQRWFQRERQGTAPRPRPATVARVGTALRRAQLAPGRPSDATFVMEFADRGSNGTARRVLRAGNLQLRPGTMGRLADTWVRTGQGEAVATEFLQGVGDGFYRRWLTPAAADRDPAPGAGAPSGGGAPAGDDGDDFDGYDPGEGDDVDWLDFYDDVYAEDQAIPDEDSYGADPT